MLRRTSIRAGPRNHDLIIEEPAQLLGKLADRRLGTFGRIEPVVMDMPKPRVGLGYRTQLLHGVQQRREFFLAGL